MKRDVLLFVNKLFNNNSDVINRHKNYVDKLFFCSSGKSNLIISKHISSLCQKHSFWMRCDCYGVIFLKLKKPKLQIQCHGVFGDDDWAHLNFRNFLFSKLAWGTLNTANQIRCVGKNQARKMILAYGVDPKKIVIAPIPTKNKGDLPEWIKPTIPVVSFLGRLHKERSVDVWVQTAQEIFSVRNDVHFLIIGDGPERENFKNGLGDIPVNQVSFVGKLPNEEALELMAKSSLLLSTAPFESFGMAMVEAAKIGIPIVSKPTSGALDLSEGYDSISLGNNPKELAELALAALNRETPGVISDSLFLQSENEAVEAIVHAWIKLL